MIQTTTNVSATGKTGGTCQQSGPYRSGRNAKVTVFVKKGARFPADTDGAATTWALVAG
jgi:hypothetical protein